MLDADVNTYKASDSPCAPPLAMLGRGPGNAMLIPVPSSTDSSVARMKVVDDQVHPEVAQKFGLGAGKTADSGYRHSQAHGGGKRALDRDAARLGQRA